MPEAKPSPDAGEGEEVESDALDGDALDLDGLRLRGDVDGLLTLAKACRSGTVPGGRDLAKCLAAYRAAAELGSGDAEYAVALFCMSGGVVPQDLKEGTTRLRGAAERGSVPAKIYLGNLYELGIFYKTDAEKADVWYRNAARGARVASEPGTDDYAREMAELGAARFVLALTNGTTLDEAAKTRLLQRAKAHGHGLRVRDENASASVVPTPAGDRPTFMAALESADAPKGAAVNTAKTGTAAKAGTAAKVEEPPTNADAKAKAKPKPGAKTHSAVGAGLTGFGYAIMFVIAGVGSAYAAMVGAQELVAHGHLLPGLGMRTELVFPIVFGAIGVLPTFLVYRFMTVLKALVIGAAIGGVGWIAWGTGRGALHAHQTIQSAAFAIAGFIAALLVLGMLGGTKATAKASARAPEGRAGRERIGRG